MQEIRDIIYVVINKILINSLSLYIVTPANGVLQGFHISLAAIQSPPGNVDAHGINTHIIYREQYQLK